MICKRCQQDRPLDCFYFRPEKGVRRGRCRKCDAAVKREKYVSKKSAPTAPRHRAMPVDRDDWWKMLKGSEWPWPAGVKIFDDVRTRKSP